MGESKRRRETLGQNYGQEPNFAPWVPFPKSKVEKFIAITTRGAWIGIGCMIAAWITIRFIGPTLGWWELVG
ncbi:MAG: DUF2839 domain-containing protein [Cyanothece sp. SIO1E1]|nr:DUF2839 domain-containing protein [Cyanothece sp. SIO1E1]